MLTGLDDEPLRPLTQLVRILPGSWHCSTFPWVQCLHQTRGGSLRISELAGLTRADVTLAAGAHVHTIGKGRKERRTPLIASTKAVLKAWLAELGGDPAEPLFPTTTGKHLSRDAIERRLARHLTTATQNCE